MRVTIDHTDQFPDTCSCCGGKVGFEHLPECYYVEKAMPNEKCSFCGETHHTDDGCWCPARLEDLQKRVKALEAEGDPRMLQVQKRLCALEALEAGTRIDTLTRGAYAGLEGLEERVDILERRPANPPYRAGMGTEERLDALERHWGATRTEEIINRMVERMTTAAGLGEFDPFALVDQQVADEKAPKKAHFDPAERAYLVVTEGVGPTSRGDLVVDEFVGFVRVNHMAVCKMDEKARLDVRGLCLKGGFKLGSYVAVMGEDVAMAGVVEAFTTPASMLLRPMDEPAIVVSVREVLAK
jgi:hypothetical protein